MLKENISQEIYFRRRGRIFAMVAASLWGISGTSAQYLFQSEGFSPEWLVVIRLLVSGICLLFFTHTILKNNIFKIFSTKHDIFSIIVFSFIGMLGVQYTYFITIKYSNAATATILQYLSPVVIALFLIFRFRKLPTPQECMAILLALMGTFLIITNGNMSSLIVSKITLFWGIISAVAAAFNTLLPRRILAKWGSNVVTGWGMLLGGIFMSFIHSPFNFVGKLSVSAVVLVAVVIVLGTLIPFMLYMDSLKHIKPTEASVLGAFEPLSAAFLSLIFLNTTFTIFQGIGTMCIIMTTVILSKGSNSALEH
ncbi:MULTISPECIES: DMT family transporter [Clostridium]|uniref:DMT family transporter n=1 Tax=Clostridium TaxID=1485 RepID=UPI000826E4D6|nr:MULTISPECIES: DMT family transporter [Clostridium]PJI07458.1 EamA family transporter [Clostridium sp. CT7]